MKGQSRTASVDDESLAWDRCESVSIHAPTPIIEPDAVPVPPDSEVPARHARRRFTTAYKVAILRRADACTRYGELGALLRKEGLYSSHVVTWRQPREAELTPKKRGRKMTAVDPQRKKLEQENRRLTSRLQKAEALLAFQKKVSELLQIPLKPFVSDEDD